MDDQLEQAVNLALQGNIDAGLRQQALNFCNQVRDSNEGWQLCLSLLTSERSRSQDARFFALQVIDSKLGSLDTDSINLVRTNLFAYTTKLIASYDINGLGPAHLRNKLAQTFGYLFVLCYVDSWSSFFDDFIILMKTENSPIGNPLGVDLYIKILRIIHDEIGETIYFVSDDQAKRNASLKDCIRQKDMYKLADSWRIILETYTSSGDSVIGQNGKISQETLRSLKEEIVEGVMKVIGGWVLWMDITLIVTPAYLNLIFDLLLVPKQRITACDTIGEIVLKKMKSGDKLELISLLNLENLLPQLPGMVGEDLDFGERVAKLTNIVTCEALHVFDGSYTSSPQEIERAERVVGTLFPVLIDFFTNEYDEVSQQTLPFLNEFLQLVRRQSKDAKKKVDTSNMPKNHLGRITSGFPADREFIPPHRREMVQVIMEKTIVIKMKYDKDADWEEEQQDEDDEFLAFRDKLRVLLDHVAAIEIDMYVDGMSNFIRQSFTGDYQTKSWTDIELGMYLLSTFGDSIKNAHAAVASGQVSDAQKALNSIFTEMVQSDIVLAVNHPSIQKWYMELVVRHAALFTNGECRPLVNKVLELFVSPMGVHNPSEAVRVRSWYLFFRLVKLVKAVVGDIGETVLNSISDLLSIKAEVNPTTPDDDSDVNSADTVFNSQLYLFELCGLLVAQESGQDTAASLARSFLQPLYSDIEQCLQRSQLQDPQNALQVHHDLFAIGTFLRGFGENVRETEQRKARDEINNVTNVVSAVMERLNNNAAARDGVRTVFIYLLPIMGLEILGPITQYISVMLSAVTIDDVEDFLGFLGQLMHKAKGANNVFELFCSLIGPLVDKTLGILERSLNSETVSTDASVLQEKTKRAYLQFLYNIMNNGLGAIFLSANNQGTFSTVMTSLFHFAAEGKDLISTKLAITVLNKMLLSWGTGTIAADPPEAEWFCKGMEIKESFTEPFVFEHYTKLCWQLPSRPWFNNKDYKCRSLLSEMALLQKTLYEQKGQAYARFLGDQYLPSAGLPQQYISEYLENLENLKIKEFRNFFAKFVCEIGSN